MRLVPALAVLLLLPGLAAAQTLQPETIAFSGAPSLSQSELLAASGLIAGKPLTSEQVQAATQRLADTGLFADVRFRIDNDALLFALKPTPALLQAQYVNFPWWTDAQLGAQLAARVPLFHGAVPLSGGLQQQVAQALQAMLAEKNIPASIEAILESSSGNTELKSMAYRVTQPVVAIGALSFTGAGEPWSASLAQAAASMAGKEYGEGESPAMLRDAVLRVFRANGYVEAAIPEIKPGTPAITESGQVLVPFALTIVQGEQYRLGSFSLAGSPLIEQATFLKNAPLKPGDIVEEEKLRRSLLLVTSPYAAKGYIDASVNATPTLQTDTRLVDYAIRVVPGELYHMGRLSILQLDEARKAKLLEVWSMQPGDAFDQGYAAAFLKKNGARLHLLDGLSANYRQIKHFDTRSVDLEVTFKRDLTISAR